MAFTLIGSAIAQNGGGGSATTSSIDTTGADLIVIVTAYYPDASETVSDSKGNTWTALTAHDDTGVCGSRIYYCLNPTVGTGHTFTFADLYACIMVSAWSEAHASSSFDQQNGAIGSGSPLSTGSITPGEDNELVIAGFGAWGKDYASVDSGFTTAVSANYIGGSAMSGALSYKVQTTAAAVNPAFTSSAGGYAGAAIASFKAAGAAPVSTRFLTLLGVG